MSEYRINFDSTGRPISAIVPRYAFKFAAASEYTLASLSESCLWFSRPNEFNDLFELPARVPATFVESDVRAYLRANIRHHWPKHGIAVRDADALEASLDRLIGSDPDFLAKVFRTLQDVNREIVRIHCFSMRYDDPLMWAHYAASYSGVCLVYDFPLLVMAGPWFALQVKYVDTAPVYDPIAQSFVQLAAHSPYANYSANLAHDQIQFGTKLMAWSHEQEIRLCTLHREAKHPYPRSALLGVILGPRLNTEAEDAVRRAAAEGREHVRIEALAIDRDRNLLLVPGLENYAVELPVAGVRNLARERRHETNIQS